MSARTELFLRSGSRGFRLGLPRGASGSEMPGVRRRGRMRCDFYLDSDNRKIGALVGEIVECFVGLSDGRGAPWSSPAGPLRTPNRSGVLFVAQVDDLEVHIDENYLLVGSLHLRRVDDPQWCWKDMPR